MLNSPLVTVALPVFNGADTVEAVARSVLAQDHDNIELLIADNASSDDTQDICRELAGSDPRVSYHRQPTNIGLLNNFEWTKHHCRGEYLRWIGDNDELHPNYVSRCLVAFAERPASVLVTTQIEYLNERGAVRSMRYVPSALPLDDPVARLGELLALLSQTYLLLDPLYGMARIEVARRLSHDRMVRGDEVYAAKLALAGPWSHVAEVLARRNWSLVSPTRAADLLDVPRWQAWATHANQTRVLWTYVNEAALSAEQRRRAHRLVLDHYAARHWSTARRRARKIISRLRRA